MWSRGADDENEAWMRRMTPPENEFPVGLPLTVLLARTDDVAVGLTSLHVYSTGMAFTLVARGRTSVPELNTVFWGHGSSTSIDERLLVGVEHSDGRRVRSDGGPGDDGPLLTQGGGSGGDRTADMTWWLTPLPPPGPLTFVVRCPAVGIEETRVTVDLGSVAEAASRVVELWPWTPPEPYRDREDGVGELPPDSWFAR